MKIFTVGLNHKTAPISVRDKVSIKSEYLIEHLNRLKGKDHLLESCIVSTCNRTELYGTFPVEDEKKSNPYEFFAALYPGLDMPFSDFLYYYTNEEAVHHLFKVSAGLDSLALGEPQVFGQIKFAYQEAVNNKNTNSILNRLFLKTFSVTKRIRTETKIGEGSISISFAAVELARKIFGDLSSIRLLVIGAGETGTIAAHHLKERGVSKIIVANRTFQRAERLAAQIQGTAIRFSEIGIALQDIDVVVTCIGADNYIIVSDQVNRAMSERKNRPLFFIDLGAPRDIDPAVNSIYNIFLYDIDNLKEIVESNAARRQNEVIAAEKIIEEEVKDFLDWYSTIGVFPVIQKLQERFESIRNDEIVNNKSKLSGIDSKKIELLTKSIVKKLLKEPILRLKDSAKTPQGLEEAELLKKLFGLDITTQDDSTK
jgi:glutamyl-tRNA reductase